MNRYVLDANVFIQAKNDHYGMDFCPAFWEWLLKANEKGQICSIKAVGDEMTQSPEADEEEEDELSKWVKSQGSGLFVPQDQPTAAQLPAVANWANSQQYTLGAVSAFLSCADMYLVAFALAHQHTIVTHEKASDSRKKLKIPDACRGMNLTCIRPYEMLRNEGARFVLQLTRDDLLNSLS